MAELWDDLLACLALDGPADDGSFEGKNLRLEYHRLFGGQLLAQFVRAAELTCPGKAVKSLHVLFPREGTADEPVRYAVRRHHEGRTFGSLTILATQSRGVIGTASVSVHAAEDSSPDLQAVEPVPGSPSGSPAVSVGLLPFETRTSVDLDSPEAAAPEFSLWWRTPSLPPDTSAGPALAAYATDLTLIGTGLRAVPGVSQRDAQVTFASAVTSHTVWFHRPFRTDDWLLLRQHSPSLAGGRSFGRGDILTAAGTLVASYAQEAMVRFRDGHVGGAS